MRLVSQAEPLFAMTTAPWSNDKRMAKIKAKKGDRLIYRCGIKHCPRVEPHWTFVVEKKLCYKKGCKRLADPELARRGAICRQCYLIEQASYTANYRKKRELLKANG